MNLEPHLQSLPTFTTVEANPEGQEDWKRRTISVSSDDVDNRQKPGVIYVAEGQFGGNESQQFNNE